MCEIRLRHKKGHWVWVRDQGRVMEWSKDGKPLWMYGIHLDISAIKAAQKTLEESEARFRGYIDHSPNGVFVAAPDGHFVDINPSASTLVGYSREELLAGMNVLDIFGMGDMPAYLGQFETTLKHGHQAEVALRRKNGSSVVVMLTAARLPDGRLLGFAVDLTERKRVEAAIEQQRRFRDILMEAIPGIAYALDTQGRLIFFNQLLSQFSEMPVEAHLGMNALEFFEGDDRTSITDAVRQTFEMGHTEVEATIVGRQGRRTPFFFTGNRIEFDGQPIVVGVGIDISERKLAEARMRQAMVVFNTSKQGIMTTDADGIITAINPAFSVITGYAPDEVIGHPSSMLKSGRHNPAFYQMLWTQLSSQGHWEGEIWNQRRNGELYPQWLTITAVKNPLGTTADYVSLFSDITERKEHEESMWRQANFDALTGLANRNLLADRLQRAIANAKRNEKKVGLAFLDLDGFKWINDTLGHDVGDELLIEVGRRLIGCVRDQDTAARLGGDEFTLVIHDLTDAQDMLLIGEKLVQVLHEPFLLDGHLHQLSGSVGITLYPDDGEDVQTLLKNADIAMYKAKQGGKNRYQFYARHMQLDAQERVRMEADLRSAIAAQSFALHYQPIVDADSGELIGAEALLRWQHPERGMVPPLDFIPVAEDCGLIVPIGEWVLREAARQWQTWHKQGFPPLRVSVNVSSLQFREADFCQLVERTLQEFEVTPGLLMLEMTESVLMDSSRETEARMRDVKALGVGYSLDDFGTGFSSLSYLKRFPVDVVKIDRSFIHDCPDDQNDAHLVEAIINMAHSLNLKITAEGVENKAQLEFLRNLGCDMVQGYLIDRALPPDAFGNLIERHQLLLPADGASLEESRFLAALRDDELDVDAWLTRLIGEQVSDMAVFASNSKLQTLGIDLRQAIQVHLDWRRRLNNMICNRSEIAEMNLDAAGSLHQCALGGWIANHLDSGKHCFLLLDEDHKIFHQMAGQIVRDYRFGHHSLARRALSSLAFRKASRDVVTALIACYFTLGGVERGATAGMSDIQRF
jgi:diguanylate cyclase (GGDEF)-like protein/PAS domain S-box-containing protein